MPSTENEILKVIWENKGEVSLRKIIQELKLFNLDYCRFLCNNLIKNKFIEFSENQYKITNFGKRRLEALGIIKKAKRIIKSLRKVRIRRKREIGVKRENIAGLIGFSPKLGEALKKKGFKTSEDLATTTVSKLMGTIKDLKLGEAARIINKARERLKKEGKAYLWE